MRLRIGGGRQGGVVVGQIVHALLADEVELHPGADAGLVDPHVGVRTVTVHVPPGLGNAAVAHQVGDLVRRLGRQRPEVPAHVPVLQTGIGQSLLATDEVRELHRVPDEEDRRVVADQIPVAFGGVELERESARIADGVGRAGLAGHGGETREHLGLHTGLEQRRLGELADVLGGLEVTERAATLGVHDPLRHPLAVEVGHLVDEVEVVQQQRSVRADAQRELIARRRRSGVGGGHLGVRAGRRGLDFGGHIPHFFSGGLNFGSGGQDRAARQLAQTPQ